MYVYVYNNIWGIPFIDFMVWHGMVCGIHCTLTIPTQSIRTFFHCCCCWCFLFFHNCLLRYVLQGFFYDFLRFFFSFYSHVMRHHIMPLNQNKKTIYTISRQNRMWRIKQRWVNEFMKDMLLEGKETFFWNPHLHNVFWVLKKFEKLEIQTTIRQCNR